MATPRVIQYVAGGKNNRLPAVYLHCRVKPNASKTREGVTALTDDAVELCVAAVPRDGASNRAVLEVLSKVSFCIAGVPAGNRGAGSLRSSVLLLACLFAPLFVRPHGLYCRIQSCICCHGSCCAQNKKKKTGSLADRTMARRSTCPGRTSRLPVAPSRGRN